MVLGVIPNSYTHYSILHTHAHTHTHTHTHTNRYIYIYIYIYIYTDIYILARTCIHTVRCREPNLMLSGLAEMYGRSLSFIRDTARLSRNPIVASFGSPRGLYGSCDITAAMRYVFVSCQMSKQHCIATCR